MLNRDAARRAPMRVCRVVAVLASLAACAAPSTGSLEPGTMQVHVNADTHYGVAGGSSSIK